MSKWTVEANADTIATIECHYPVQFWPERTCRVERMEIDEFGRYFYLSCGHMQMTHNNSALPYCPICGVRVIE